MDCGGPAKSLEGNEDRPQTAPKNTGILVEADESWAVEILESRLTPRARVLALKPNVTVASGPMATVTVTVDP